MKTQQDHRYSRREFGKLTLAGVPAALVLARAGLSAADSKINGVRIGAQSYSFREMSLEDALKAYQEIGIGECELFSGHIEPRPPRPSGPPPAPGTPRPAPDPSIRENLRKFRLETPLSHFTDIKKKFDAAGVKIQAYNLSFNESFTDEEIDRGFQIAKALGAGFITASSTVKASEKVAPFADKHKMFVAMHNHSNVKDPNEFATPESFAAAMKFSKFFRINLDIGHFVAANYDPIAFINEHHAHITNLHLKDRKKDQGANLPWGEGDTPIKEVLQLLRTKKYDIPANIEYEYKGENTIAEVKKCFAYCKTSLT
jgi:sugar phosphate isomerase/epimerase